MPKPKKSFDAFLNERAEETKPAQRMELDPEDVLVRPDRETRSVRMQIVITPTLKKQLEKAKKTQKMSTNEIINQILNREIKKYVS